MSKRSKGWLIAAISLILVGGILFTGVMTVLKWDFKKLSTVKYETNTYTVADSFTNISVADSVADVTFAPSTDGTVSVVCYEQKNLAHSVAVEGDTLVVKPEDTRKWYHYIGIGFDSPKITVYLPKGTYGDLTVKTSTGDVNVPKGYSFASAHLSVSTGRVTVAASVVGKLTVKASTGNIRLKDFSVGGMDLTVSTGHITASAITCDGDVKVKTTTGDTTLTDVTCRNLSSEGSTGDLILKRVTAAEAFVIERDTGDVRFDACDAATLSVTTDTGDIKGSLLTEKVFITSTDTGRVDVPESTAGGKCKLTTDTGDIEISLK